MASVSSLDHDMRNLRLGRYTPKAANECRSWIEDTLGERLAGGDLLDALKDGVALCKLANRALPPPGLKYKPSPMPFIQMENISHFLRACELPPLNMPAHDRFLTVDLYESKDPAQVLQCLIAFSRAANAASPANVPTTIGPKKASPLGPTSTGAPSRNGAPSPYVSSPKPSAGAPSARPMSPAYTGGSTGSRSTDATGPVSSWSKKGDEGVTNPAWNIHQYGYMGGASQGNQGVAFGARRQITSASPQVPSLAEKERKRREKEVEEERLRLQAEEAEHKRRVERQADEERERMDEEQRWEDETRQQREQERQRLEEQKRQWEEQERKWKADEEVRMREHAEDQRMMGTPTQPARGTSDGRLRGQFLSHYQAEQGTASPKMDTPEKRRVLELERQLEEAKERERQYQIEREGRPRMESDRFNPEPAKTAQREAEAAPISSKDSASSWAPDEREYLRQQWQSNKPAHSQGPAMGSTRPLPELSPMTAAPQAAREQSSEPPARRADISRPTEQDAAPKFDEYQPVPRAQNRTEQYLAYNPLPETVRPSTHQRAEMGFSSTLEEQADVDRRMASQQKTKAGGWASKSLLEREMERERERQKEWETNQESTKSAARDTQAGTAPGQSWDVNQYGFTGGDNQNKGSGPGSGIGFGGRRQIIGPRPLGPRPPPGS